MNGRQGRRRRKRKGTAAQNAAQAPSRPDLSIEAVIAGMDARDREMAALVALSKRPPPPPSPGNRVLALLSAAMLAGGVVFFGGMVVDGLQHGRIDFGVGRHSANEVHISGSFSRSPVMFGGTMLASGPVAIGALGLAVSALSIAFRGTGRSLPERG